MRIALATCAQLPDWEVDDRPLVAELEARGVEVLEPAWDASGVDWSAFDACLIRTTWDYMARQEDFVAWAARVEQVTRLFNPAATVRWNTHKRYLRELEARGAPLAPTVWLDRGAAVDVAAMVRERGWTRAFVKPQVGASARETLRFDADRAGIAAAQAFLERTLAVEDMMVQPYLPSVETEGELSAIFFDGRYSHGVRKVPVAGDYRVQDDFGAHDEPYRFRGAELALAERLAGLAGGLLYARVDLLRDPAGQLRLNELEVVEPSLFFRHDEAAAGRLAAALIDRVRN